MILILCITIGVEGSRRGCKSANVLRKSLSRCPEKDAISKDVREKSILQVRIDDWNLAEYGPSFPANARVAAVAVDYRDCPCDLPEELPPSLLMRSYTF